MNFLNIYIYSSKIINLRYNSIFLRGFVGKAICIPVQSGIVSTVDGGQTEGLVCADPGARTLISVSGINCYEYSYRF